jgi:hypothetical protein
LQPLKVNTVSNDPGANEKIKLTMRSISRFRGILWVHVKILKQASLREGGLVMYARAAITVSACSDFKVERAIDSETNKNKQLKILISASVKINTNHHLLVLFSPENRRKIFSHRFLVDLCDLSYSYSRIYDLKKPGKRCLVQWNFEIYKSVHCRILNTVATLKSFRKRSLTNFSSRKL